MSATTFSSDITILHNDQHAATVARETGLQRLRQSRLLHEDSERACGMLAGSRWALELGEFGQVERVAALHDSDSDPTAIALSAAITGVERQPWNDVAEALNAAFGSPNPSEFMIVGFVEGVAQVFDEL